MFKLLRQQLWTVYRKEMRDALRDKRSMRLAFLPPLYFAAIFIGLVIFAVSMANDKKVSGITSVPVYVQGAEYLPELTAWLKEQGAVIKPIEKDAYAQVKAKSIDVALIITEEAKQKQDKGESASVWLVYDGSNQKLNSSVGFLRNSIYGWNNRRGALNVMARGIAPDVASPIVLRENNIADEQKMSVYLLASVPMTLMILVFMASVGFSADMTAGERERRSLESLLITPATNWSLLLGKWFTSLTLTVTVLLVELVLLSVAFRYLPFNQLGLKVDVTPIDMVNLLWVLLPVALFAVSLQLSFSLFAKSFKDAQSLMAMLMFVPMMINFYIMFNPGVFYSWWLWVPVLGESVVVKDIILGNDIAPYTFAKCWLVSAVLTVAVLSFGMQQWRRPNIIYGQ